MAARPQAACVHGARPTMIVYNARRTCKSAYLEVAGFCWQLAEAALNLSNVLNLRLYGDRLWFGVLQQLRSSQLRSSNREVLTERF